MSDFMQKQVVFDKWVKVDGSYIEYVPLDLVGWPFCAGLTWVEGDESFADRVDDVQIYIEQSADEVTSVEMIEGWGARLSAPGYMDCTEWTVFVTEKEARQHLDDVFGEDEE